MSAAQKKNLFKVNLFINKGERPEIYLQVLKWLISSGRYIVIFVELVVIIAFISRYKLDADLAAIQEEIKEIIPYIQSLKADEKAIKETQYQLFSIKQIKDSDPNYPEVLNNIAKLTPQSIKLSNITIDRSKTYSKIDFSINGQTPSNIELSAFIKALKNYPLFSEITLTNISFEGITTFTITGVLNKQQGGTPENG